MENIIPLCKEFEEKLIKHIWRTRNVAQTHRATASLISSAQSQTGTQTPADADVLSVGNSQVELTEKVSRMSNAADSSASGRGVEVDSEGRTSKAEQDSNAAATATAPSAPQKQGAWYSWRLQPRAGAPAASDAEKGSKRKERKLVMIGPIYAGLGAAMAACECSFSLL